MIPWANMSPWTPLPYPTFQEIKDKDLEGWTVTHRSTKDNIVITHRSIVWQQLSLLFSDSWISSQPSISLPQPCHVKVVESLCDREMVEPSSLIEERLHRIPVPDQRWRAPKVWSYQQESCPPPWSFLIFGLSLGRFIGNLLGRYIVKPKRLQPSVLSHLGRQVNPCLRENER